MLSWDRLAATLDFTKTVILINVLLKLCIGMEMQGKESSKRRKGVDRFA